jgi:hypothetical protein
MVHFTHDKLELWYRTADAPAPNGSTEQRRGVSVTVGVRPANSSNSVRVRYRVDARGVETVPALLVNTDFTNRVQYFRATFPTFWSGEAVEYLPVVSCEGRRAPDPVTSRTFPSAFRLAATDDLPRTARPSSGSSSTPLRHPACLEHLVHATVPLASEPEVIGQTPLGFCMNWYPTGGTLDGPALTASVIPGGEHQTLVRPDGIGVVTASVSIRTHDGMLISLHHSGTTDFGVDWAERSRSATWPSVLPVRTTIRLLTSAPKYQWLNRLHCLSIGEVRPHEDLYSYDMYAVR